MKNLLFTFVLSALSVACAANEESIDWHKKPANEEELQQRKAIIEKRILQHTGGKVIRPGTQSGEVVVVNCQKTVGLAPIKDRVDYFAAETKFKMSIKEGSFDIKSPAIQGNVSLFIIDDSALPPILIAPESRWSMVNVAPLKLGRGQQPAFLEARLKREVMRGLAMLCGASNSNYPRAVTAGVSATEQLDSMTEFRLQVDIFRRMVPYMVPFGVTPAEETTYLKACQEGWAAQPTNEYQKAIWDKVHEIPTEPITIKPESHPAK